MKKDWQPFTDKQLVSLESANHSKGDRTAMIQKLARELRTERSVGRELVKQLLRYRTRVIHMETAFKPVGRVLLVDNPPIQEGVDHGFLEAYIDPLVQVCWVTPPVHYHDPQYDEALEWELSGTGEMFRRMPWEVGPYRKTGWTRWTAARQRERAWREFVEAKNNDVGF